MKKDIRYKGLLGIVANLVAHEWALVKKEDKYYLVYGEKLTSEVYDILLLDKGTIYSDCLVKVSLDKQDLFLQWPP